MESPCTECPHRDITCTVDQLFMDCNPWDKYAQALMDMLIQDRLPKIQPKRRWFHVTARSSN